MAYNGPYTGNRESYTVGSGPYGAPPVTHTSVIVQQPGLVQPRYKEPVRGWTHGLFGCFDDFNICCLAYWCAPCYTCSLSNEMEEGCCMPFCVGIMGAIFALRIKLRTERNIEGSIISDFCTTLWCGSCALCQLAREYKNEV